MLLFTAREVYAVDCIYASKPTEESPYSDMYPQGDCGTLEGDDILHLKKSHFERLRFSEENLAWIIISEPRPIKVFYVSRNGKVVRTHFFDNSADYFEEGLARMILNDKFGYINKELETVIPPKYDFAFPFQNEHAIVCNQCKPEPAGEHKEVTGGNWGVINKDGKVIIPITLKRDELIETEEFNKIYGRPF